MSTIERHADCNNLVFSIGESTFHISEIDRNGYVAAEQLQLTPEQYAETQKPPHTPRSFTELQPGDVLKDGREVLYTDDRGAFVEVTFTDGTAESFDGLVFTLN